MSSSSQSFYFASHRSTTQGDKKEIDHLSPRQEKKLSKQQQQHKKKKTNPKSELSPLLEKEPAEVNALPEGAKVEEFYSRPVIDISNRDSTHTSDVDAYVQRQRELVERPSPGYKDPPVGSFVLNRKVPVKVEPKVFLAAERTFLLWMHSALWLFGASTIILAYAANDADPRKIMYGASIMPVALAFTLYSLIMYVRRVRMLRQKLPGPYEDLVGPTVLCIMLILSIVTQFAFKLFYTDIFY